MGSPLTTSSPPGPTGSAEVAAQATAVDLERLAILAAHGMVRPEDARRLQRAAQEIRRLAAEVGRLEQLGGGRDEAEQLLGAFREAGI